MLSYTLPTKVNQHNPYSTLVPYPYHHHKCQCCERWEWVEIIEPRTRDRMYANLTTGECVWEPPHGVRVKETHENQWWELFDQNTSRYYYYNATSQKTVWHRPNHCDIIPLAKLQTMKLSTEGTFTPTTPTTNATTNGTQGTPEARRRVKKSESSRPQRPIQSPQTSRRNRSFQHYHSTGAFDSVDQLMSGRAADVRDGSASLRGSSQTKHKPEHVASAFHRRGSLATSNPSRTMNGPSSTNWTHESSPPKPIVGGDKPNQWNHDRWASHSSTPFTTSSHQTPNYTRKESIHRSESFDRGYPDKQSNYSALSLRPGPRHHDNHFNSAVISYHKGHMDQEDIMTPPLSSSVPSTSSALTRPRLGTKAMPRTNPSYRSPMLRQSSKDSRASDPAVFMRKSSGELHPQPQRTSDINIKYSSHSAVPEPSQRERPPKTRLRSPSTPELQRPKTLMSERTNHAPELTSHALERTSHAPERISHIPERISHTPERSIMNVGLQESFSTAVESPLSTSSSSKDLTPELLSDDQIWQQRPNYNIKPSSSHKLYNRRQPSEPIRTHNSLPERPLDFHSDSSSSTERMVIAQPTARLSSEANKKIVSKVEATSPQSPSNPEAVMVFPTAAVVDKGSKQALVVDIKTNKDPTPTEQRGDNSENQLVQPIMTLTSPQTAVIKSQKREGVIPTPAAREKTPSPPRDIDEERALNSTKRELLETDIDKTDSPKHTVLSSTDAKPITTNNQIETLTTTTVNEHLLLSDCDVHSVRSDSSSLASLSNVVAPCGSIEDLDDHEQVDAITNKNLLTERKSSEREKSVSSDRSNLSNRYGFSDNDLSGSELMKDITSTLDVALTSMDEEIYRNKENKNDVALSQSVQSEPVLGRNMTESSQSMPVIFTLQPGKLEDMDTADYVNIPHDSSSGEDNPPPVVMRQKANIHKSASTNYNNRVNMTRDITSQLRSERVVYHSMTDIKPSMGRPISMVVDSEMSPPQIGRPVTRQHTFTPSSHHSKASSLARGLDMRKNSQSEGLLDWYTENSVNRPKKTLFGKKSNPESMLSWSAEPITKPMLRIEDKILKKDALETFKLIQMYMGDRKAKQLSHHTALSVSIKGWGQYALRDEIFVQLIRQVTDNPKDESITRGWELLAICLTFFPPSQKFHGYLDDFIMKHLHEKGSETEDVMQFIALSSQIVPIGHYAHICKRRLFRLNSAGARKALKKPTLEEIEQSKRSIYHPSMFGDTLDEIMLMQKVKYPDRKLPWIQTTLSESILRLNGARTEGIFRVPADQDEVNTLKVRYDHWETTTDVKDPHLFACLLKLWYRELYEPIIPPGVYEDCMEHYDSPDDVIKIIDNLPEINKLVLAYLIRFLQVFAAQDNVSVTKMDINNLAMVMAPNCLRCDSEDPRIIFENTRKEMQFLRTLIQHMDTSFMEGVN